MLQYEERRRIKQAELDKRREKIYSEVPQYEELQKRWVRYVGDIAKFCIATGRTEDNAEQIERLKEEAEYIREKKSRLLKESGHDESELEIGYFCCDCKDTGYIGSEKCHCFNKMRTDILYKRSGLDEILERENFDNYTLKYYTTDDSKKMATKALHKSREFIDNFDSKTAKSLYIFGDTGTGKTFLVNCIAKELMDRGKSILYFSSVHFFDVLRAVTFQDEEGSDGYTLNDFYNCDLLIIDDLGTETPTDFVTRYLFHFINERLTRSQKIIITTNLGLKSISDMYSHRILSRIAGCFEHIKLDGDDIRMVKSQLL